MYVWWKYTVCYIPWQVDAIDYYAQKEGKYREQVDTEKVKAFKETLGIAFVTFENSQIAARWVQVAINQ